MKSARSAVDFFAALRGLEALARLSIQHHEALSLSLSGHLRLGKPGKGISPRAPAATFERQLEDNLVALQNDLAQQTYQPGAYHNFYIHEPKRRREHCTACVESRTGSGPGRASRLSREAGRIVKRLALRSSVNPARAAPC